MCPVCRQPVAACVCKLKSAPRGGDGVVRVSRETQGRGGKSVTVIRGLALSDAELGALAKRLKAACGAGGTVKDGVVEVQGEHAERAMAFLVGEGFKVKRAGG